MTTFAATAGPTNNTDAEFRTWINVWHSMFTAASGWVQTADTGQVNYATVTRPLAANTKMGYALYAMNDALQATKPVIVKVAYGSGAAMTTPGVWFSIGTGTDGAGNFTDANDAGRAALLFDQYSQAAPAMVCAASQSTLRECFGSVSTDRFVLLMFEAKPALSDTPDGTCGNVAVTVPDAAGGEQSYVLLFSVERARDWAGATLGTHIVVVWSAVNGRVSQHIYLDTSHDFPNLAHISGMVYALDAPPVTPLAINSEYNDLLLIENAPATPPIPFARNTYPSAPGINVMASRHSRFKFAMDITPCVVHTGAYVTGRTIELAPYGTARTYRTCAGMRMGNFSNSGTDASAFVYVLYE